MSGQGSGGNVVAAVCSFFIVGLGQLVQGRVFKAILFFVFAYVFYGLSWLTLGVSAVFGFIVHVWSVISAAKYKGDD